MLPRNKKIFGAFYFERVIHEGQRKDSRGRNEARQAEMIFFFFLRGKSLGNREKGPGLRVCPLSSRYWLVN